MSYLNTAILVLATLTPAYCAHTGAGHRRELPQVYWGDRATDLSHGINDRY